MNHNYKKGRHNEYRSIKVLEAVGYFCVRAAGSHGPFDIVGLTASDIVVVQCKTGEWPAPAEMESMRLVPVPANCRKLVHRWNDRAAMPLVKEV